MAARLRSSPSLVPENNPAPDTYDTTTAFRKLTAKSTPITLKSRVGGTQLSANHSTGKCFAFVFVAVPGQKLFSYFLCK
jgi:hypothetical protein